MSMRRIIGALLAAVAVIAELAVALGFVALTKPYVYFTLEMCILLLIAGVLVFVWPASSLGGDEPRR